MQDWPKDNPKASCNKCWSIYGTSSLEMLFPSLGRSHVLTGCSHIFILFLTQYMALSKTSQTLPPLIMPCWQTCCCCSAVQLSPLFSPNSQFSLLHAFKYSHIKCKPFAFKGWLCQELSCQQPHTHYGEQFLIIQLVLSIQLDCVWQGDYNGLIYPVFYLVSVFSSINNTATSTQYFGSLTQSRNRGHHPIAYSRRGNLVSLFKVKAR